MDEAPAVVEQQPLSGRHGSGTRAHELLASLDAAKRQKVQNEKMRHMILDSEELLGKLHSQTFSSKQRLELERAHARCAELLDEMQGSISYSQLRKFNVSKYMVACAQEMQVRDLVLNEDQPDPQPLRDVSSCVQDMRGQGENAAAFSAAIDRMVQLLGKCDALLGASQLKSQEWATVTEPLLRLMREIMHMKPIGNCVRHLEEQCKRLGFSISEVDEQQQDAVEKGEMAETEQLYYKKVTMQEALADTITRKFDNIEEEETVSLRVPLEKVRELHSSHQECIQKIIDEKDSLKRRCEKDLSQLNSEMERVNLDDYNETKQHELSLEKTQNFLKENLLEQDACWAKIESLEKELAVLGQKRTEAVKRHIKQLETNETRKVEHSHFMEWSKQHKQLLERTIHNCEIAEEVTDLVDEMVSSGCNAIEARMRETEQELSTLRLNVHEEYLGHFRSMYLTLGDLQYKKEANIQALEEKIQVASMQQEMYMESLNPKAKEYSQLKRDLAKMKEDMASQVQQIRDKATLYIEAFQPTEHALIEAGREFRHPVEELKENNERRKNKLIAYHQLVGGAEEGADTLEVERQKIENERTLLLESVPRRPGSTPLHAEQP